MLKWIGHTKGVEGLPNIPARDLAKQEVEKFGGESALLATGLYIKPAETKISKPKRKHEKNEDLEV